MTRSIKMIGLDCGSTTTSAIVARGCLTSNSVGRVEITGLEEIFRSEIVFTPFDGERLDVAQLGQYVDDWLAAAGTPTEELFGGGALITGLAAQRTNAAAVSQWIETRLHESVVATADDPCLESWLAFMGNCHALSKAQPEIMILNLDIGGGTTNLALGIDGQVIATGCLYVGARHFQFVPGTYQILQLSRYARALLEYLKIQRAVGDLLAAAEVDAILTFYVQLIEAAIDGDPRSFDTPIGRQHLQVLLQRRPAAQDRIAITLSGGVGQIAYRQLQGEPPAGLTTYGDLGEVLAARILSTPGIAGRLSSVTPEGLGRATVFGLLRHSTELSGSTIYLPKPQLLPLKNVPIVGRLSGQSTADEIRQAIDLAARSAPAACLQIELEPPSLATIRPLADRLAEAIRANAAAPKSVLVLLVPANLGKVLGNYVTRWGKLDIDLIVLDEVPDRDAQFVRLGRPREGIVPVWLYAVR